jgi:hypothetical protein
MPLLGDESQPIKVGQVRLAIFYKARWDRCHVALMSHFIIPKWHKCHLLAIGGTNVTWHLCHIL